MSQNIRLLEKRECLQWRLEVGYHGPCLIADFLFFLHSNSACTFFLLHLHSVSHRTGAVLLTNLRY